MVDGQSADTHAWSALLSRFEPPLRESPAHLAGTVLFYPCTGNDWREAIEVFAPLVDEFWFVDTEYFRNDSRPLISRRADGRWALCWGLPEMELFSWKVDGSPTAVMKSIERPGLPGTYPDLDPCVRTEIYWHSALEKRLVVHWRRGFGAYALRHDARIGPLGVFFYRGDSFEGGTGQWWLGGRRRSPIQVVVDRIVDGGLIVTDGSNCCPSRRNDYRHFGPAHVQHALSEGFEDRRGNRFVVRGRIKDRYGPTLVWQIHKAAHAQDA